MTNFTPHFDPWKRYAENPSVDRRGFPHAKAQWVGDKVCIRYMARRGHARQRTLMRYVWGVLVTATDDALVAVQETNKDGSHVEGRPVTQINYTRVQRVWNLSRKSPA